MKRRQFIKIAASSLLAFLTGNAALARNARPGNSPATVFFDERFPEARRLAESVAGRRIPTPVRGDITDVWKHIRMAIRSGGRFNVSGVTTESFAFCLDVLAREHARTGLDIRRLNRDLHAWVLRVTPRYGKRLDS